MATVRYSSNNSGGMWWLYDDDWRNLAAAGWKVEWYADDPEGHFGAVAPDGRFLGALATAATRKGLTFEEAIAEWEEITGEDAEAEGCDCCGGPHYFYEERSQDAPA